MSHFIFDSLPGRTAYVKGKEFLFFSGYAYLGVQFVDKYKELVKEGLDRYGWLYPSSRISNTQIALFEECEELLSNIMQCESTVLCATGYTAGRLATGIFNNDIVNLQPSHPAIKQTNPPASKGIYAVDAVNILTSTVTDTNSINNKEDLSTLIIDDSHGAGLTGTNGAGASSYTERKDGVDYIFTYSLSKAWGINAGAISCPKSYADRYKTLPSYTGATPPSPALIYAFIKGQHIYAAQRQKLQQNIAFFKQAIAGIDDIINDERLPIFILPNRIDEEELNKQGIIISSFAYPNPAGPTIKRVVLNALHTTEDLEKLAAYL